MTVAIYCRVSTEKQELEQQINACIKFCEYKGYKYEVFSDVMTGKHLDRPAFIEMLKRIRKFEFEYLILFRFDRLGRNAREVVTLLEEFENKGIKVISINENIDTSSPIGKAIRDIILRLAQLERENISLATRQRLEAMKESGKKIGRPVGSKDKGERKKEGYLKRWQKEGHGFKKTNEKLGLENE